jgi:hypothetical protein
MKTSHKLAVTENRKVLSTLHSWSASDPHSIEKNMISKSGA